MRKKWAIEKKKKVKPQNQNLLFIFTEYFKKSWTDWDGHL